MAIAAHYYHVLSRRRDGRAEAAGWNGYGQLGDGTTESRDFPVLVADMLPWVSAVAAGYRHSCFLTESGEAWACGDNSYGQLGDGSFEQRTKPVKVLSMVRSIACGSFHTLFFKIDGTVWATGANKWGQLGDGTSKNRASPVQVCQTQCVNKYVAISAGLYHSLFVTETGCVHGTGYNGHSQLAAETVILYVLFPIHVFCNIHRGNGSKVRSVVAGETHSVFIGEDNNAWVVGDNSYGQLGIGNLQSCDSPRLALDHVQEAAASAYHTLFLRTDGKVMVSGWNKYGQLGPIQRTSRIDHIMDRPVEVGGFSWSPVIYKHVVATYYSSFVVRADHGNSVDSWGYNDRYGMFGIGEGEGSHCMEARETLLGCLTHPVWQLVLSFHRQALPRMSCTNRHFDLMRIAL